MQQNYLTSKTKVIPRENLQIMAKWLKNRAITATVRVQTHPIPLRNFFSCKFNTTITQNYPPGVLPL